jgi:hypothetical protein
MNGKCGCHAATQQECGSSEGAELNLLVRKKGCFRAAMKGWATVAVDKKSRRN